METSTQKDRQASIKSDKNTLIDQCIKNIGGIDKLKLLHLKQPDKFHEYLATCNIISKTIKSKLLQRMKNKDSVQSVMHNAITLKRFMVPFKDIIDKGYKVNISIEADNQHSTDATSQQSVFSNSTHLNFDTPTIYKPSWTRTEKNQILTFQRRQQWMKNKAQAMEQICKFHEEFENRILQDSFLCPQSQDQLMLESLARQGGFNGYNAYCNHRKEMQRDEDIIKSTFFMLKSNQKANSHQQQVIDQAREHIKNKLEHAVPFKRNEYAKRINTYIQSIVDNIASDARHTDENRRILATNRQNFRDKYLYPIVRQLNTINKAKIDVMHKSVNEHAQNIFRQVNSIHNIIDIFSAGNYPHSRKDTHHVKKEIEIEVSKMGDIITTVLEEPEASAENRKKPNRNLIFWDVIISKDDNTLKERSIVVNTIMNVDGGSAVNLISEEIADMLKVERQTMSHAMRIRDINGGISECAQKCKLYFTVQGTVIKETEYDRLRNVDYMNTCTGTEFVIMRGCPLPILLGSTTSEFLHIASDLTKRTSRIGIPNRTAVLKVSHVPVDEVTRRLRQQVEPIMVASAAMIKYQADLAKLRLRPITNNKLNEVAKALDSKLKIIADKERVEQLAIQSAMQANEILINSLANIDNVENIEAFSNLRTELNAASDKAEFMKKEADYMNKYIDNVSRWLEETFPDCCKLDDDVDIIGIDQQSVFDRIMDEVMAVSTKNELAALGGTESPSIVIDRIRDALEKLQNESVMRIESNYKLKSKLQGEFTNLPASKFQSKKFNANVFHAKSLLELTPKLEPTSEEIERTKADIEAVRIVLEELAKEPDDKDDDISSLIQEYSLNKDETDMPEMFPQELWKYVQDSQKPLIKQRWSIYTNERLTEIIADLHTIDICKSRKNAFPYFKAQAFANISRYYHADELNPPTVPNFEARMDTTDEIPVTMKKQIVFTFLQRIYLTIKCEDLESRNKVEDSESHWQTPPMLVEYPERIKEFMDNNQDRTREALDDPKNRAIIATFYRFTMDCSKINLKMQNDPFPMPSVMDAIEDFSRHTHYSSFDMADAFFCISLCKEHRHKTAFRTHNRCLQWCVMLQGAKQSANVWARMIAKIFRGVPNTITIFQDDCFCHAKGILGLLESQQTALDRMELGCLTFKRSKAKINYPSLRCLGHIITKAGRCADPKKIQAILEIRRPTTPAGLLQLIGLANYNREYIAGLSSLLAPFYDLSHDKADVIKEWNKDHDMALSALKQAFTGAEVLAIPDMTKMFRIFVDSCTEHGRGIGGVLAQWYGPEDYDTSKADVSGKHWKPCAYYSKLLTESERKYGATQAEAKGLHDCCIHWQGYLRHAPFEVVVDHMALVYIFASAATTANRRILNYALRLQEFCFKVLYKKGETHTDVDAISRLYRVGDPFRDSEVDPDIESSNCGIPNDDDIRLLSAKMALDIDFLQRQGKSLEEAKSEVDSEALLTTNKKVAQTVTKKMLTDTKYLKYKANTSKKVKSKKISEVEIDQAALTSSGFDVDDNIHIDHYVAHLHLDNEDSREDMANLVEHYIAYLQDASGICTNNDVMNENSIDSRSLQLCDIARRMALDEDYMMQAAWEDSSNGILYDIDLSERDEYDCIKIPWVTHTNDESTMGVMHGELIELDPNHYVNETMMIQPTDNETLLDKQCACITVESNLLCSVCTSSTVTDMYSMQLVNLSLHNDEDEVTHMILSNDSTGEISLEPVGNRRTSMRTKRANVDESYAYDTHRKKGTQQTIFKKQTSKKLIRVTNPDVQLDVSAVPEIFDAEPSLSEIKEATRRVRKVTNDKVIKATKDAKELKHTEKYQAAMNELRKQTEIAENKLQKSKDELELKSKTADEKNRLKELKKQTDADAVISARNEAKAVKDALKATRAEEKRCADREIRRLNAERLKLTIKAGPRVIPSTVIFIEPKDETVKQQKEREVGDLAAEVLAKELVGMIYEDPSNGRLYECAYVGWDSQAKEFISWRQPADGDVSSSEDTLAYAVKGPGGVEELVKFFLETGGCTDAPIWPHSEEEFYDMQMKDIAIRDIMERVSAGEIVKTAKSKRRFYFPILKVNTDSLNDKDLSGSDTYDNVAEQILNKVVITKSALRVEGKEIDGHILEPLVVIPSKLIPQVLKYFHEGMGHPGRDRVVESIKNKYWWSGLWSHVEEHINACRQCKLRKANTHAARLPLQRYSISVKPFETVHIDLTGRLVRSTLGFEYILVIKCALTQWIELIPIRNKSAEEVQRALIDRVFMVHGSIKRLISDNGQEFKGKLSEVINYLVNNKSTTITPYNPQSNSRVEQANSTIKSMLHMYIQENQKDWDLWLPVIAHAYRTTVSVATGFSPFFLVFGREAVQPTEAWIQDFANSNKVNIYGYANQLTQIMLYSWDKAGASIQKSQELKDHRVPDARERTFKPYSVGEFFYMKSLPKRYLNIKGKKKEKLSLKLQERWTGPHVVLHVYNPVLYRCSVNNRIRNVHAIRMKRETSAKERFIPMADAYEFDSDNDEWHDYDSDESEEYNSEDEL